MNDLVRHGYLNNVAALQKGANVGSRSPWLLVVSGFVVFVGFRLLIAGQFNILTGLMIAMVLFAISALSREAAIYALFAYLFLLGDIRRIAGSLFGFPKLDPLLLVGPALFILYVPNSDAFEARQPYGEVGVLSHGHHDS